MKPVDLARTIVESLEDKKGEDIVLLDLEGLAPFGEFYVICSANNERTIRALADAVMNDYKSKRKVKPALEGTAQEGWILVDFGSVVVHIFSKNQRDYYRLEELWSEAKVLLHVQ
jgi:ribosome-associated protein